MHNNIIKPWLAKKELPEPVISNMDDEFGGGYIYCPYIPYSHIPLFTQEYSDVNPMVTEKEFNELKGMLDD